MKVGLLYTKVRPDEKRLLAELRDRDHEIEKVDVKRTTFGLSEPPAALADCDLAVDRTIATSQSRYVGRFCRHHSVPVVNSPETAAVCDDKVRTSLALSEAGVPTPETTVAFSREAAVEAIESFGYPCVLKPVVGSWGRLMAKIESRSAAEAILEHKATLGHYEHSVFYVQEFVDKPGRDLRVLAADGEPLAAMARSSEHWLTNARKGADTAPFEVDDRVSDLVARASDAVGGGLLGVDLMEVPADRTESGSAGDGDGDGEYDYTVHEVNHTVEFRSLDGTSDVDVPARVVDWLEGVADRGQTPRKGAST